jgi:DNA-binding HxlR family transcriptional regulator/putative sterol carrier protein
LALELVGERWALLIVRELMFGPRRFSQLRSSLPGISANVLTQRLEGLEVAGILVRRKLPPPADDVQVYELTSWGYESETAIQELGRWAVRSPQHDPTLPLSAASIMLSFRTMIDRAGAAKSPMAAGFRLGNESFVAEVDEKGITVRRADPEDTDFVIEAKPTALAAVVYGGQPLRDAEAAGTVKVRGDRKLAERFTSLFPLPSKITN